MLTRRMALTGAAASGLAWSVAAGRRAVAAPAETFPVMHSDAEWRNLLTPEQYAVLRQSATERPFTSPLLHEERRGIFACAGCDLDLFSSTTKFDSGTGWPSFWAPLDKAVGTHRGQLASAWCGRRCIAAAAAAISAMSSTTARKPTGLRYCMNGVALTFKPAAAHERRRGPRR